MDPDRQAAELAHIAAQERHAKICEIDGDAAGAALHREEAARTQSLLDATLAGDVDAYKAAAAECREARELWRGIYVFFKPADEAGSVTVTPDVVTAKSEGKAPS